MGRGVETIGDNVIYFDVSKFEFDYDWDDLCENIRITLQDRYHSLVFSDKWAEYPYRENKILLENDHIQISISEYIGCGAISIYVQPSTEYPELAEHWITQVWDTLLRIISEYVTVLHKLGTMSNGVSVFRKIG